VRQPLLICASIAWTTLAGCGSAGEPAPEPASIPAPAPAPAEPVVDVPTETLDLSPEDNAAPDCPDGATAAGKAPPDGKEAWCTRNGFRHGPYRAWYDSGDLHHRATYTGGKLHGGSVKWDKSGNVLETGSYALGEKVGLWETYAEGKVQFRGEYRDGEQHGSFVEFAGNGTKQSEGRFEKGRPCGVFNCWDWETGEPTSCKPLQNICTLTETGGECAPCAD